MRLLRILMAIALALHGARAEAQEGSLVDQARRAAQGDRNRESADLFGRAVSGDPALRRAVLREWADQLTYSERAPLAVPLYREVLTFEEDPRARRWTRLGLALALSWTGRLPEAQGEYEALIADDPQDVDARLGRARVLAWRDRWGPSRDEYLRILAQNPNVPEARRELARVQWWSGRPRDAQRRLHEILRSVPDENEARLLLAEVQGSLGRPDLARRTVTGVLADRPEHRRAAQMAADLALRARPTARVQQHASEQSDRLDIRVTTLEQRFRPGGGRGEVELRYEFHDYDPDAVGGVRVHRPGAFARFRISDRAEINGGAHVEAIRSAGSGTRNEASYDAWLTVWPHDVVRLDLSSRRALFDDLRSLEAGITGTYHGVSADFNPTGKTRLTARGNVGSISDGNRRRWGQLESEHRIAAHPRTLVGARFTGIDFSESTGNGYFEPQDLRAGVATLRTYDRLGDRLWWELEGSYGREDTRTADPKPIWGGAARFTYRVNRRAEADLRYHYFSSLEGSSGGFARGSLSASVRYAW
jgi:tetratricopeptide (TPR) repeat protein